MKKTSLFLAVIMVLSAGTSQAAITSFCQRNKLTLIQDGVPHYRTNDECYQFRVEVISDSDGLKFETVKNGKPFVAAQPGERYAIRVYNPLPVRAAVNLTVDGLNTITGKPSGISDGSKWMIDPYSYITVRGWQVNEGESRRFFFTEKPKAYAAWQGERLNKDLAANCGVIGAAFFWNRQELQGYYDAHPEYQYTYRPMKCGVGAMSDMRSLPAAAPAQEMDSMGGARQDKPMEKKEKAGTGMGERESHPTTYVDFRYNTGMYKASQALVLFYDFAKESTPNPFPGLSYAPEMD